MAIARTTLDLWEQRIDGRNSQLPVIYDQGPFFVNAFALWLHAGRAQSRRYHAWHQRQIDRSRQILDLLIWLEADEPVLAERINSRSKSHSIKGVADEEQQRFFSDFSQYFCYVNADRAGNPIFSSMRFRTDNLNPSELAEKIREIIA